MRFPHGKTVIRLRRRLVLDPYSGEETLADWSSPDELAIPGCALSALTSREAPNVDRDQLTSMATLLAPFDADIEPEDRIQTPNGTLWHVTGRPKRPESPFTGWRPGCVVPLTIVEARS